MCTPTLWLTHVDEGKQGLLRNQIVQKFSLESLGCANPSVLI